MNEYYTIQADCDNWEYAGINSGKIPPRIRKACITSEFQYVDRDFDSLEISEESGEFFPDFIYDPVQSVPLISDKLKDILERAGVDNIFLRHIELKRISTGESASFWLAVPPRIICLDVEKCSINKNNGKADNIVILDDCVGNYKIFKLSGVSNDDIIITGELYKILSVQELEGVILSKL